ncbi:DUF1697 domain-containing protein [Formosa haliotis]|uniref:DUF1697 domain-containing protein n=1 Tax=Formosa haliotis TaxID=1555194 RepID=UPI0008250D2D|nr:DUF1697 domain-containing protein [Formosa haliotis]
MKTYIALLRGINVSGQKKVPMAMLRELMTGLGFKHVKTYIQSGNVVFQSIETNTVELEQMISKSIVKTFQFEVPVLVKSENEIRTIFEANPFSETEKESSYFTLLKSEPAAQLKAMVSNEVYANEVFVVTDACVYFYSTQSYGKAKCNNNFFERKLNVSATTRNFKTMQKLLSLCSDL